MTRTRVALLLVAVLLFAGSAWFGFSLSRNYSADKTLAQSGWCCMADSRSCVVSKGFEECRAQDGILFNWNATACSDLCVRTTTLMRRGAGNTNASPAAAAPATVSQ